MALGSFFTSAILIVLLVLLRRAEIKRGGRYFPRVREKLDHNAVVAGAYLTKRLPRQIISAFQYVVIHATDLFTSALLRIVRFIEARLHRFVHVVRGKKHVERREPTSEYFNDVRNHKEEFSKTIEELESERQ